MKTLTTEQIEFLEGAGHINCRYTEDGVLVGLMPMMFTTALVSDMGLTMNDGLYHHRYCYPDYRTALLALSEWDGRSEPMAGWTKYKGSDGERSPKGEGVL